MDPRGRYSLELCHSCADKLVQKAQEFINKPDTIDEPDTTVEAPPNETMTETIDEEAELKRRAGQ